MNTRLTLKAAPLLILATLFFAGCGASSGAPNATPSPERTSLEGRFAYEQMGSFLETVRPMVAQFFQDQFPDLPGPRSIAFVARSRVGSSACGYHDSQAYEYCPASQSIFIGQDLLWAFFRIGDAAPVVGLAHEWGHHLQALKRVPAPRTAAQSVSYENQADCIAGAWAGYADDEGWLEAEDDLADVGGLLQVIGSRESSRRDHGTAAERDGAFRLGFRDGLKGCNSFSPSAPIA